MNRDQKTEVFISSLLDKNPMMRYQEKMLRELLNKEPKVEFYYIVMSRLRFPRF